MRMFWCFRFLEENYAQRTHTHTQTYAISSKDKKLAFGSSDVLVHVLFDLSNVSESLNGVNKYGSGKHLAENLQNSLNFIIDLT